MFTTPRKQKQQNSSADAKEYDNNPRRKSLININANTPIPITSHSAIVFENGTLLGNISNNSTTSMTTANSAKLSGTSSTPAITDSCPPIAEVVISADCSANSLNQSLCDISQANNEESAIESTALLETTVAVTASTDCNECSDEPAFLQDEFEQFILNRTTSESNIFESSIYSELHFPPSLHGGGSVVGINANSGSVVVVEGGGGGGGSGCGGDGGGGSVSVGGGYVSGSGSGGSIAVAATQMAAPQTPPNARQTKRIKRKHKTKAKCTATAANLAAAAANQRSSPTQYPPRYTAIFMDTHHHANQFGGMVTTSQHHSGGGAANALGQIASAAASSPFLNAPVATDTAAYMQQFQYFQQRPMLTAMAPMPARHYGHHRTLFDAATTTAGIENPLNLHTSPTTTTSVPAGGSSIIAPPLRLSFRKWFSRPSLPVIIGILALGGVACTLGGIVLGSTGLIEHSTQYLSAALLMIGIGVSLLVISGSIWRLSVPDDVEECPCYRHMEICTSCNSRYCNSRLMGGSYLYPEFQHRPPPPSYLTSLNECAGMSLLFHPSATAQQATYSTLRLNTPPPLYQSTNSLSLYSSAANANQHHAGAPGTTIVPNLTTSTPMGIVPDHSIITMSAVMENLQAQAQPLIKEFNYLDLD